MEADMGRPLRQLVGLAEGNLEEPHWIVESFEGDRSSVHEGDRFTHQQFAHCAGDEDLSGARVPADASR